MQEHMHDELSWQAFRYASGEMNESEVEAFEERLADDQAAREALAQTVMVGQAVVSAMSDSTTRPVSQPIPNRRSIVAAFAVAGLLAAVAVGWGLSALSTQTSDDANNEIASAPADEVSDERAGELISIWGRSDILGQVSEWSNTTTEEEEVSVASVRDDESEFTVPAWMLAAVEVDLPPEMDMDEDLRDPKRIP